MQNMYFFITIANRQDDKEFINFFEKYDINNIYSTPALGTASDTVLDLLGIAKSEKTIHISILSEDKMRDIKARLTREMLIDLPGRGIAMAIPLSSIGGRDALNYFSGGEVEIPKKTRRKRTQNEVAKEERAVHNTELIIVICEKGHNGLVMDAARAAGARGGTVIRAKGTGSQYTDKFFGLSIAEEKEIVYIVSSTSKKPSIMKAIMENAGAETQAHAVVFSLPVTDTAGLRLIEDKEN